MNKAIPYIIGLILIAALILVPLCLGSYYVGLMTLIFIFAIFAMSLDILQGYAGMASLGHAAFLGTSAYVVGILNVKVLHGHYFGFEFAAGLVSAALMAAILGFIVLKAKDVYFLMITLAASMMLWGIAFKWRALAGGDDGLPGISRPDIACIGLDFGRSTPFYYFVLFFFLLSIVLMYMVVHSPFGHTLRGIRESDARMESLGYNIWLHRYIAFIVAAFFAGVAGNLIAYYNGYVCPSEFDLVTSAEVLIMVILGGAGTLFGPAIGAFIIILIKTYVSGFTEHWMIALGAIYIAAVMFAPEGVYVFLQQLFRRWVPIWRR
jgi:branched-chain amino acid transport system permease protein